MSILNYVLWQNCLVLPFGYEHRLAPVRIDNKKDKTAREISLENLRLLQSSSSIKTQLPPCGGGGEQGGSELLSAIREGEKRGGVVLWVLVCVVSGCGSVAHPVFFVLFRLLFRQFLRFCCTKKKAVNFAKTLQCLPPKLAQRFLLPDGYLLSKKRFPSFSRAKMKTLKNILIGNANR